MTKEQKQFIVDNALTMSDRSIQKEMFDKFGHKTDLSTIYRTRMKYGLSKPIIKFNLLTDEHKSFIRENGLKLKNEEMYQVLKLMGYKGGRTIIRDYRRSINLNKPKEGSFVKEGYVRKVYQDAFGEIPEGMTVKFKDGNSSHVIPSNLTLSTEKVEQKRYKMFGKSTHDPALNELMTRTAELELALIEKRKK